MAEYKIVIRVEGQDAGATNVLGGVGGALGNVLQIAAGGVLAGGFLAIGNAINGSVGDALEATKAYENLGIGLESLVARELRSASGIEKIITVGQQRIELTQKEIEQLGKLRDSIQNETLKRDVLAARIQEQKERIRQLTEQYGENGLVVIKERAELAQMEQAYQKTGAAIDQYGAKIAALEGKQGKLVDVTQKVIEGQLSMNEALEQAGPKAKALLDWVQEIAIKSPFKQSDIANAFKTAMAYGFTSDQAKELTQMLVDFSAVADPTGQKMGLIAYALGQIRTSDKLLTQDLRQLMNAGIDVNAILGKMGYKLSDVGEKSISSKEFLEHFIETMKNDFVGAAERSAGTLTGLLSSLEDIKEVGLRNLFEGGFGALKPLLQDAVNLFSSTDFMDGLRGIGTRIGEGVSVGVRWLQQGIAWGRQFLNVFQGGPTSHPALQALNQGVQFFMMSLPIVLMLFSQFFGELQAGAGYVAGMVLPVFMQLGAVIGSYLLERMGLFIAFARGMLPVLGQIGAFILTTLLPPLMQLGESVLPYIAQGVQLVEQNFGSLAIFIGTFLAVFHGSSGLLAVLAGTAAVLPVVGSALALITSPLFLISTAVALLATAWINNWGGIQQKTAEVWAFLQPLLASLLFWLQTNLPLGVQALQSVVVQVLPSLQQFGAWLGPQLLSGAAGFVGWLSAVAIPTLGQFGSWIVTTLVPGLQQFATWLGPQLVTAGMALGNFINTQLLPALTAIGVWIFTQGLPSLGEWFGVIQGALPILTQFAALVGQQLGTGLQQLSTWAMQLGQLALPVLRDTAQQLAAFALPLLAQAFQWVSENLNIVLPILGLVATALGLVLAPVIALPAALVLLATAWANNWGGIQEKTAVAWGILEPILGAFGNFLGVLVAKAMELGGWLNTNLPLAIQAFQNALTAAQPVIDLAGRGLNAVISIVVALSSIWSSVNRIVSEFNRYLQDAVMKLLGIERGTEATQKRLNALGDFLGFIGGVINDFIQNFLARLVTEFGLLVGILETLAHWLGVVGDVLSTLQIPEAFQRHSPSPFEQALMGANEHLRTLLSLIPRVNFQNVRFGDFGLLNLTAEKFTNTLVQLRSGLGKLATDPAAHWTDVNRQLKYAVNLFNMLKSAGVEMPGEFRAGLESAVNDLLNIGNLAPEMVAELKKNLGGIGGAPLAAAGAGAATGAGGAATYDQRKIFNNYGPVYITSGNPEDFFRQLEELQDRIETERRLNG